MQKKENNKNVEKPKKKTSDNVINFDKEKKQNPKIFENEEKEEPLVLTEEKPLTSNKDEPLVLTKEIPGKQKIVSDAEKEVKDIESQFASGLVTKGEKYNKAIDIWTRANEMIAKSMIDNISQE